MQARDATPVRRILKLKCQACRICIGIGFYERSIYLDLKQNQWVCRGCARWHSDEDRFVELATEQEVDSLKHGDLNRLLRERTKTLRRKTA